MSLLPTDKASEMLLRHLWQNGDAPRVQLAKVLGVTKSSITQLTTKLVVQGVLSEKGELMDFTNKQPRGRRRILLGINENYKLAVGLVITANGLYAGLCNLRGGILSKLFIPLKDETHHATLELMSEAILRLQKENCIPSQRLLGVGVTIHGACPFIEGSSLQEQGRRLVRELGHGVDLKLAYSPIAAGALLTWRLFGDSAQAATADSALMVMVFENSRPQTAVFANGELYLGKYECSGGGRLMPSAPTNNDEALFLASTISNAIQTLDTAKVITYISLPSLPEAAELLTTEIARNLPKNVPLIASALTPETLFLSPAAAAVDRFLFV